MKKKGKPDTSNEPLVRAFTAPIQRRDDSDGDGDDTYSFKISSDDPAEMWRGVYETLGHKNGEIRMDWYESGNAPLLWMHARNEQIGVILSATRSDKFLEIEVKFGESKKAKQIKRDVDNDTIKNVSIGYRVHKWEAIIDEDNDQEHYRAIDWEPLEASFVTIPADKGVGVGRSEPSPKELLSGGENNPRERGEEPTNEKLKIKVMEDDKPPISQEDLDKARADGIAADRKRMSDIDGIAEATKGYDLGELARKAKSEGTSIEDFQAKALEHIQNNAPKVTQEGIGASQKEERAYSLRNVLNGLVTGDMEKHAPYEMEVSAEMMREKGGEQGSKRFAIPQDVLMRGWVPRDAAIAAARFGMSQRDLQSVTLSAAGESDNVSNIVDNALRDDLFVYMLTENNALLERGVTWIPNMVGDATIPLELLYPQGQWVGEKEAPAEGNYLTGNVGLSFKTFAYRIPYTYRADKQSTPNIESLLSRALRVQAPLDMERTIYSGDGTVDAVTGLPIEPTGILNTAGIGSVVSAGTYSRDALINLRQELGVANAATGGMLLVMSEHSAGEFAKTKVDAGSGIFVAEYSSDDPTRMKTSVGPAEVTNLIPNTANGDANSVVAALRPGSVVGGMWGAMEIDLDDTTDRDTRTKTLRLWHDWDMDIPQPASIAVIADLG